MDLADIAGWVAPAATMAAATMTAANLGARVTGWGFVVFAVGSVAWTIVAMATQQGNLLWTNAFLLAVNVVGIWRWLGRQARYADGAEAAADVSARAATATLLPVSGLPGRTVLGRDGEMIATLVEAMVAGEDSRLAYVVISEGGVAGMGERLHALAADCLTLGVDTVTAPLDAAEVAALPVLGDGAWPTSATDPRVGRARPTP
ncbi:MAG: PRC-barrel domain-containing protein [Pseudomonadota bacterium]